MKLREYLVAVATHYDRQDGMSSEPQRLLRDADELLASYAPAGVFVAGSGGAGTPTFTPWVRFYDPDESPTPASGVYLYYLFDFDGGLLWLTLSQGITRLSNELGAAEARERLRAAADAIRDALGERVDGLQSTMALGGGFRQAGYAAGTIAALKYPMSALPPDSALATDLERMLSLSDTAVAEKRRILIEDPGRLTLPASRQAPEGLGLESFKPKSSEEYAVEIEGRSMTKSRRHERLVRDYGEWALSDGFVATTPHPRDLVLQHGGLEWLVEAKVLYSGDATAAVRAAIGQLLTYRYFLYSAEAAVNLVALFSEPIGAAYVECLERLGIAAVWLEDGRWNGSRSAVDGGLAESLG